MLALAARTPHTCHAARTIYEAQCAADNDEPIIRPSYHHYITACVLCAARQRCAQIKVEEARAERERARPLQLYPIVHALARARAQATCVRVYNLHTHMNKLNHRCECVSPVAEIIEM